MIRELNHTKPVCYKSVMTENFCPFLTVLHIGNNDNDNDSNDDNDNDNNNNNAFYL